MQIVLIPRIRSQLALIIDLILSGFIAKESLPCLTDKSLTGVILRRPFWYADLPCHHVSQTNDQPC